MKIKNIFQQESDVFDSQNLENCPLKMYLADQDSSRVAKCEVFYTDQIFQTKLYPKKSAQVATNLTIKLNEIEMNDHFWVEKAENSIT